MNKQNGILEHSKRNSYIDIKTIVFCIIIGILNSFYYGNFTVMAVLSVLEVIMLFCFLINRDYVKYIAYYMVFLCFSMESETFVGVSTFYGFKNFRIAGLNLAIWMLFPIIIIAILNYRVLFSYISGLHRKFINEIIVFTLIGLFMGFVTYLINDNGFSGKAGSMGQFINAAYGYVLPCLELIAVSWCVNWQNEDVFIIKKYLYSVIISTSFIFVICFLLGNYGNRGGLASLQVSEVYFLLVGSIILIIYREFDFMEKALLVLSGCIIIILSLAYNASGKIVIIAILTPIIMILLMRRNGSPIKTVLVLVLGVVTLMLLLNYLLPLLMQQSLLLTTKFDQAKQLFSFTSDDWFANIPSSPKMRITEFMNVAEEFMQKPWFLIFGKGFGGTIKDNLGLFNDLSEFAFSQWELELGAYGSLHESINCFFLVGGIFGLYVILANAIRIYKNMDLSPWLLFGFMWLLLFYNYHMSIGIYGIVALVVGLNDLNNSIVEGERQ